MESSSRLTPTGISLTPTTFPGESARSAMTSSVNSLGRSVTLNPKEILSRQTNQPTDFAEVGTIFADCMRKGDEASMGALGTVLQKRMSTITSQTTGIRGWFKSLSESGKQSIQTLTLEKQSLEVFIGVIKEAQKQIKASKAPRELRLDSSSSIIYNPETKRYVYIAPAPPIENLVISGGGAKGDNEKLIDNF